MKSYAAILKKNYFPQGDPKKFSEKVFMKELKAAMRYGELLAFQHALKATEEIKDRAELIGELQIKLIESYKAQKDILGLRVPTLKIDDIMPPSMIGESLAVVREPRVLTVDDLDEARRKLIDREIPVYSSMDGARKALGFAALTELNRREKEKL